MTHHRISPRHTPRARLRTGLLAGSILGLGGMLLTPLSPAQAVVDATAGDGGGTRIISQDDRWRANLHLSGGPVHAEVGEAFTAELNLYEAHDSTDERLPERSAGLLFLGATHGIAVEDIRWTCDEDRARGIAEANGRPTPQDPCTNQPSQTLNGGSPYTVEGTDYTERIASPYTLVEGAGWSVTVTGRFTEEGPQRIFATAVDSSYLTQGSDALPEQFLRNGVATRTQVGGEAPAPETRALVRTSVSQESADTRSGQPQRYTVHYANTGTADLTGARAEALYALRPEAPGDAVVRVTCAEESTAPCPVWADGRERSYPLTDHDHDHDHGHGHQAADIARFGNVYSGPVALPGGTKLILDVEQVVRLDEHAHGEHHDADEDRAALSGSMTALLVPARGAAFAEGSVASDGVMNTLSAPEHDDHGDDAGDHDDTGKRDDHDGGADDGAHAPGQDDAPHQDDDQHRPGDGGDRGSADPVTPETSQSDQGTSSAEADASATGETVAAAAQPDARPGATTPTLAGAASHPAGSLGSSGASGSGGARVAEGIDSATGHGLARTGLEATPLLIAAGALTTVGAALALLARRRTR